MKWRFHNLDWKYAIGELLIVTAGVLIALGFDQWRQEQLDKSTGNQYVVRLKSDVERDIESWDFFESRLSQKLAALNEAENWLRYPNMEARSLNGFLENLVDGARRGYGGIAVNRNTFDELINNGQFGLIEDTALRDAISSYYALSENEARRISARITPYPSTVYQLVPRDDEYEVSSSLTDHDKARIAERAATLDLEWLVIAERNFGLEMSRVIDGIQSQALALERQLDEYL